MSFKPGANATYDDCIQTLRIFLMLIAFGSPLHHGQHDIGVVPARVFPKFVQGAECLWTPSLWTLRGSGSKVAPRLAECGGITKKVGNQRKQLIIFVYIFWVEILNLSRYSLCRSSQVQGRTPSYFRGRVYLCMQGWKELPYPFSYRYQIQIPIFPVRWRNIQMCLSNEETH